MTALPATQFIIIDHDDEDDDGQRRPEGAGSSVERPAGGAPTGAPGASKRHADAGMFDSSPTKKGKSTAAATKRREAAAKAAKFQKAPKQPPMVSV
mgnify:CR=1 FL=1